MRPLIREVRKRGVLGFAEAETMTHIIGSLVLKLGYLQGIIDCGRRFPYVCREVRIIEMANPKIPQGVGDISRTVGRLGVPRPLLQNLLARSRIVFLTGSRVKEGCPRVASAVIGSDGGQKVESLH